MSKSFVKSEWLSNKAKAAMDADFTHSVKAAKTRSFEASSQER